MGTGEEEAFVARLRQVRPEWRGTIQVVFRTPPQMGDCKRLSGGDWDLTKEWDMTKEDVLQLLLWKE